MSKKSEFKKVYIEFFMDVVGLTENEKIVLKYGGIGVTDKMIAKHTGLSLDMVQYCKKNIKEKTQIGQLYGLCKDHRSSIED